MGHSGYHDKPHTPSITLHHNMDRFVHRNASASSSLSIHLEFDVSGHDWIWFGHYRIVTFLKKLMGFKAKPSPIRPLRERRHKQPSACTYALSAQAIRWMR